ncbi:hypothetical protein BAUCODRAFT_272698 [Baudoinia panamericana UAMH 10762]|uniref:Uncharacterized protein n=1 Tax=Baudoinia panamericana (strain UAMH 10762) TaxID=717646 RepID=M2N320_BAUPA|nr:uncharacterized protein BAUCODRAFT_272698 [Baudoinia panamericana UAMH 10762]EMC93070.1 hypothetical protein BAUCODRAFT_272698 [Baudoinia panamericana UAMH 10762]
MCVARLHVTKQPCQHRWFQLVRPCDPANNLANCPGRLQVEGWEMRNDTCPWCDSTGPAALASTHQLFGSTSSTTSVSSACSPLSLDHEPTRPHRSASIGTLSTLSRHSSSGSTESERGRRHRDMNERLHLYLTTNPHEVLPSAGKYYPSQASRPVEDKGGSEALSIRSTSGTIVQGWKKSVRFSHAMFKT